jgi:hypothetical protein
MPRDLPNPSRSLSLSLLNASVVHPLLVLLGLKPLTLYDTPGKPIPLSLGWGVSEQLCLCLRHNAVAHLINYL